jgi:hypothetical protein
VDIDDWDGTFISASATIRFNLRSRLREFATMQEHPDTAQVGRALAGLAGFGDDVDRIWTAVTAERQQLHPEWPPLERPAPDATMPPAE